MSTCAQPTWHYQSFIMQSKGYSWVWIRTTRPSNSLKLRANLSLLKPTSAIVRPYRLETTYLCFPLSYKLRSAAWIQPECSIILLPTKYQSIQTWKDRDSKHAWIGKCSLSAINGSSSRVELGTRDCFLWKRTGNSCAETGTSVYKKSRRTIHWQTW